MIRIYVGNLAFETTEDEVRELFAQYGTVQSVDLIMDRDTGRPRGFGFVAMDDDAANKAIGALDGSSLGGRTLRVSQSKERPKGGGGGGRGGDRMGGGRPEGGRGPRGPRREW